MYINFFFFTVTATTEIYTLSLHDALPICRQGCFQACQRAEVPAPHQVRCRVAVPARKRKSFQSPSPNIGVRPNPARCRSEEHTSELQSQSNLVCRLLLEKKKKKNRYIRKK